MRIAGPRRTLLIRDTADLVLAGASSKQAMLYLENVGVTKRQARRLVEDAHELRDREMRSFARVTLGDRWALTMQRLVSLTWLLAHKGTA